MGKSGADATKFTIVIPTRERCDTLAYTLKTCVTQDYDNCRILICDNFSQDNTRQVVESFTDSRINYINTGKRLSMSHNWEFALSHISDGYVILLGDDDGLMPEALSELDKTIRDTGCDAITWSRALYGWPNALHDEHRSILSVPVGRSLEWRDSAVIIDDVINCRRPYLDLPMLYIFSAVNYKVIKRVTEESGAFLHSANPDIYSGLALASTMDRFYSSSRPFSIGGTSHHSNGASFKSTDAEKKTEAQKFFSEGNIPFHPKMVFVASVPLMVAESALQVQEHIPYTRHINLNMRNVLDAAVRDATWMPVELYKQVIAGIRETANRNDLSDYAESLISKSRNKPTVLRRPVPGFSLLSHTWFLDCGALGINDVYAASVLASNLITLGDSGVMSNKSTLRSTLSQLRRGLARKFGI